MLAIGEKEKKFMKKRKIKYRNEPLGKLKIIKDFLPPPRDLVLKEKNIKVTLSLTKESIDFFKKQAKSHSTRYQKMIRALVQQYVLNYKHKDLN